MPTPGDIYNPWRMFHGCFIPNAVLRCVGLSARGKLVFGRLCQYAGENGEAFPSYRSLAREVGVQRRCAIKAVRELEEFGLIKAINHWRNDGAPVSNSYVFLWHEIFHSSANNCPLGVQNDTMGGVQCNTTSQCPNEHPVVSLKAPKEIQTKDSQFEETTTGHIRQLLKGTPLSTIGNQELHALAKRHGTKLLRQAADVAAETWRRDREEIHNPGGYLQTLCNALVVPGWYKPEKERQSNVHTIKSSKRAKQESIQQEKTEREQQDACLDAYWQSLSTKEQNKFVGLVTSAYPTLQLPEVAITATAKTLAWEQNSQASHSSGRTT